MRTVLAWLAGTTMALSFFATVPTEAAEPLRLRDVLLAVDQTHPQGEAAQRRIERAEGGRLAAEGGFDPVLSIRARWKPVGYYENGQLDTVINQPIPLWGLSVYGGHRLGWGSYPLYRRELQTLSAGELRAGVKAPLWRNAWIDARRAGIEQARTRARLAHRERDVTDLQLARDAAEAYWTWVAAGQRLSVVRALLTVAEQRQAGLVEQVEAGSLEPIKIVDNRRLVLERAAKVVDNERMFQEASLKLSLFLRGADGTPIAPGEERVPEGFPQPEMGGLPPLEEAIARALRQRPDVAALTEQAQVTEISVRLAKNQRAPSVDLETFVAKDLGEGPADLEPVEWGVGAMFEMPLLLRQARGELQAARAEAAEIRAKMRGLQDKIAVEVRSEYVALRAAAKMAGLALEQAEAAETLAEAERIRVSLGSSDLVVVNLRELAAADAHVEAITALAKYQQARTDYLIATGRSLLDDARSSGR